MRRLLVGALVVVAVAGAAACSQSTKIAKPHPVTTTSVAAPAGTPVARVRPAGAQTISAFGASGAWWPNDLVQFPPAVQQLVATELFGPQALALSGYRYNIGGGGAGVTNPTRAANEVTSDTAGLAFLRAARDAHVPVLTGFVNSAPPQFTTNGKACGGALKPGSETAFADYLAGVVKHLHDDEQITLNYVSPMNEPDSSFADCGQEGMAVPVAQRGALVRALAAALAREAPYAKVIADESNNSVTFAASVPKWLSEPGTATAVHALAHHTYDYPVAATRASTQRAMAPLHEPTWMTEICCYDGKGNDVTSFGAQYDPTITQGLWLADQIHDDLLIGGDSAWYWWTALSRELGCDPKADPLCPFHKNSKGWNDGLIYYDKNFATDKSTNLYPSKRYSVLAQFSRFVRPGAVLHAVDGLPAGMRGMAFANGDAWTVVMWNETNAPHAVEIALPKGPRPLEPDAAVYTNLNYNTLPTEKPAATRAGAWLATVNPGTIVTYTFK